MPKIRQQYFADEVSLNKEARTFALDDELLQKIEDMDVGEENVIEIVKVNSVPLPVDAQKAVDVTVPLVIDDLTSTSTTNSLSANQGKILYDYIVNLQSRGRFLSSWNASTGTPVTAPFGSGYNYNPGDYYVVTIVNSGGTNYRPDGATYISGQASTVVETENVEISDMYIFDGTQWLFQKNSSRQIAVDSSLSTTSTNPVENRVITNELNNKQNKLIAGNNIQIDQNTNTISATGYSNLPAAQGGTDDTLVTTGDKYNWNNKQDSLQAGANIQINGNVISSTNTTYSNLPEAQGGTGDTLVTTGDKYNWNHKQDGITWGDNITIVNNIVSADNDAAIWGNITGTLSDQTDLQNALNAKQDKLIPGLNITIDPNTNEISAVDTTYTAADFDIKDLADSTNLRSTWSNKQDYIADLSTIRAGAAKGMTALQPGQVDNVSELINDAGYITKAVNDLTNYYNKNETYTKAEVDALIANFAGFEVVSTLPVTDIKTTVIYLLGPSANDTYEEYVYIDNQWVKIGETTIDLSNYFHKVNDDSDDIIEGASHLFMTPAERTNLSHQSGYNTGDETKQTIEQKLGAASPTNNGYLSNTDWNTFNNKQNRLLPGVGITINGDSISTSLVAGTGININGNIVTNTKPFDPTNTGSSGQVLRKGGANTYYWDNESGGGGGSEYYPGYGININSSNQIINTKPFEPTGTGTVGQVLTRTQNGYNWTSVGNVKLFTLSSTSDLTTAQEAWDWYRAGNLPILRLNTSHSYVDTGGNTHTVTGNFDYYLEPTSATSSTKAIFTTIHTTYDNYTNVPSSGITQQVDYVLELTLSGNNVTGIVDTTHTNGNTQFISPGVGYTGYFTPTIDGHPATKKYVDDRNWVGTQAQYDALPSTKLTDGVIYNILPS